MASARRCKIVAEHATIWHGFGGAETIAHKHAVLDEWCARLGRDPAEIERSAGVSRKPGRLPEDVADYAAGAEALYAVGTRLFTVGIGGPKYDLGPAARPGRMARLPPGRLSAVDSLARCPT